MDKLPVTKWFEELKRIWLEKDIPALKEIVADEFDYYEDPYLPAIKTWDELESAWQEIMDQDIKKLDIQILIDGAIEGSGMYHFIYIDPAGVQHESRGSYYLKLNSEGKAIEFRQWWTTKE
ncbi:hypothetical protein CO026_02775 [Candidatus Kaiserbacteria bacterium CG_4_9_14_0_2_um_filter_41_32]|uniref:SnoaL-like domain-containing protein n=1 Tax=Candidatus Kaiserbacteria bacterium CG_4_9_14_0_2_um_filter_41_32 TaxID=1974601 RepID=A0A2M8FEA9_9BACT|nr:MAG: hypothetical protein CO026_02775 [Candidatus Kaiserbacteria bacterium CG_4_9_14_0_2_um_filter_41_32]